MPCINLCKYMRFDIQCRQDLLLFLPLPQYTNRKTFPVISLRYPNRQFLQSQRLGECCVCIPSIYRGKLMKFSEDRVLAPMRQACSKERELSTSDDIKWLLANVCSNLQVHQNIQALLQRTNRPLHADVKDILKRDVAGIADQRRCCKSFSDLIWHGRILPHHGYASSSNLITNRYHCIRQHSSFSKPKLSTRLNENFTDLGVLSLIVAYVPPPQITVGFYLLLPPRRPSLPH